MTRKERQVLAAQLLAEVLGVAAYTVRRANRQDGIRRITLRRLMNLPPKQTVMLGFILKKFTVGGLIYVYQLLTHVEQSERGKKRKKSGRVLKFKGRAGRA